MIAPDGWEAMAEPPDFPAAGLAALPWFALLPPVQQARLVAMAGEAEIYSLSQALNRARNTVVAAVDGSAGNPEGDFLAAAWRLRGNLSAYDPAMEVNILTGMLAVRHVPSGLVTLARGSVTAFGHHVPQTDLLIPHPGPWVGAPGANALAACIEAVLGAQSTAYVLTDNEMPGNSQSQSLISGLQAANDAGLHQPGYTALTWLVTAPVVEQSAVPGSPRFTDLGGARLQIRHDPPYRLVAVSRS
jgi:hypothetical protein